MRAVALDEAGKPRLSNIGEDSLHEEIPVWRIQREGEHYIERNFAFKDFKNAIGFVFDVAMLAEHEGHYPEIEIIWNKVTLILHTHAVGGLSKNDFIMAAKIDRTYTTSS